MNDYSYSISLKVTHPTESLKDEYAFLSGIEGLIPGRFFAKGARRKTPSGTPLDGVNLESGFYLNFSDRPQQSKSKSLEDSFLEALEQIEVYKDQLSQLVSTGGYVVFSVGIFADANFGLILENELLKKISDWGIGLEFDCYPQK